MRCGRTFRLARTHPAHARLSGSGTLSRSRSLVAYTIDTHESEFSEATGVTRGGSNPFGRTSGGTASATSARSAGEQRFLIWKSNCPNLYLDDEPYRTLLDFALAPCRTVAAAGHDAIACRSPSPEPNAQIGRLCITAAGEDAIKKTSAWLDAMK